ncbi:hypothetical protein MBANPS3_011853 [Mucor bainieri]
MTSYSAAPALIANEQKQSMSCTVTRAVINMQTATKVATEEPYVHILGHLQNMLHTVTLIIPITTFKNAMIASFDAYGLDATFLSSEMRSVFDNQHFQITATGLMQPILDYAPHKVIAVSTEIHVSAMTFHTDSIAFPRLGDIPQSRTCRFHNWFDDQDTFEETFEHDIPTNSTENFDLSEEESNITPVPDC